MPEENLHLTLAFLGEQEDVERACAAVRAAAGDPGPLRTAGALWLPPRRPGVLTVAIEGDGRLGEVQSAVAGALEQALEWTRETRPFRPHVTVGRVRRGTRVRPAALDAPALDFRASAVTLFASRGGHYERLERIRL